MQRDDMTAMGLWLVGILSITMRRQSPRTPVGDSLSTHVQLKAKCDDPKKGIANAAGTDNHRPLTM